MKIIVAHNYYSDDLPSGENDAVDRELALLLRSGHDVELLTFRTSDMRRDIPLRISAAMGPIYSPAGASAAKRLLSTFRPDILHLHNPFPLLGPSVLNLAAKEGVPVVQTVHNYRHECVNGLLFRNGEICEKCPTSGQTRHAVRHGCYRGSRLQTLPMVVGARFHSQRSWPHVARFLPVSRFLGDRLAASGIDRERITVKPNAIEDPGTSPLRSSDAFVATRLTEEKGIRLLLDGWIAAGLGPSACLRIAGSGPLRPLVEQAAATNANIEYLGWQSPDDVHRWLSKSAFAIAPSACFEGFPTSVIEAMAHGRPSVAFAQGSLGQIIDESTGYLSDATADGLAETLRSIDSVGLQKRGERARSRYLAEHTPVAVMETLEKVYAEVTGTSAA